MKLERLWLYSYILDYPGGDYQALSERIDLGNFKPLHKCRIKSLSNCSFDSAFDSSASPHCVLHATKLVLIETHFAPVQIS